MGQLFEKLVSAENLYNAWQHVKAKGSAGGVDKMTIEMFDACAGEHIQQLQKEVADETYIPEPYQTFSIPKDDNEFRKLGLPTVRDKIVQNATRNIIEPIFEKQFLNVSYGYRPGKGAVKAIHRVQHRISGENYEWVTLADIDNFFDTINPEILFRLLDESLHCGSIMRMIRLWVQIGAVNFRLKYLPYTVGIPQGSVLSPLFSNIYLHPFDQFLVNNGYAPVRYADDFVIFSRSQQQAQKAFADTRTFLENTLKLKLNKEYRIRKAASGFEFLHIHFHQNRIGLTPERLEHLKDKVAKMFDGNAGLPDEEKAAQKLKGIINYYGQLLPEPIMIQLDLHFFELLGERAVRVIQKKESTREEVKQWLEKLPFLSKRSENSRVRTISTLMEGVKKRLVEKDSKPPVNDPGLSVKRDIETKRRKYEKMADAGRELVVTQPGLVLGISQKGITLKEKGVIKTIVNPHNLQNITIMTGGISLSGPLIRHCSENRIPIDFIGFNGLPYARLSIPSYPDAAIGIAQLKALESGLGVSLIKQIVSGKLKNQLSLIKYYHKYRKSRDEDYAEAFERHSATIAGSIEKIGLLESEKPDEMRASVMGLEGTAAAAYWDMIVRLLNNYTLFEGRERQGATDLVNSMLNYGYGILYSRVCEAITRERLNPHISYLHVPDNSKPTLAFDLIEEFRQQVVDRAVIALISKGEEVEVDKGKITPETKKRLVEKILERLNNREKFRGRELHMSEIIRHQAHAIAIHVQGGKTYKPYLAKW